MLFQNISSSDNEEIFVEIKTTSLDYSHFYWSSGWISRPEQGQYALALSIYTHQNAQWDSFPSIAWEVLADRHRNDGYYMQGIFRYYFQGNEEGLYEPWLCHLMTIGHLKQPWNIEPSSPMLDIP